MVSYLNSLVYKTPEKDCASVRRELEKKCTCWSRIWEACSLFETLDRDGGWAGGQRWGERVCDQKSELQTCVT